MNLRDAVAAAVRWAAPCFYRIAPLLVFSLIDDPAMLALASC
jgi:hypothetical protein